MEKSLPLPLPCAPVEELQDEKDPLYLVKMDFHSHILLIADETFALQKCTDTVFLPFRTPQIIPDRVNDRQIQHH